MQVEGFEVLFPECKPGMFAQDQEFCVLENGEKSKRIRFHDYHEVYSRQGLYEYLFYEKLKCNSPQKVCSLLDEQIDGTDMEFSDLVVLDIGAGNGMVGEELVKKGARSVVGVDIIEEAQEALERDRPGLYDDYYVVDLTSLDDEVRGELENKNFNCLTTVAALGFGDIPPLAFAEGYNLIETPGLVAFNIKDEFIDEGNGDLSQFSGLIGHMVNKGMLDIKAREKYCHRLSLAGTPLHYYAMVGVKERDIPQELIEELRS